MRYAQSISWREFRQRHNAKPELKHNATVMRLFQVYKTETTEDAKPKPEAATHVKSGVFKHQVLIPLV
jgi:hypothetical protein